MNYIKSYCRITPGRVLLNGDTYFESDFDPELGSDDKLRSAHDFFSAIYARLGADYRKFYKMDALSKLGFLASELLLKDTDREAPKEDMGIVLFNCSSSLETDRRYQKTIRNKDDFFPSPAEFVYTLPNIVTGEISIRNKVYGETAFYISPDFEGDTMCDVIDNMISFAGMKYVLAGWTEVNAFTGGIDCLMLLCEAECVSEKDIVKSLSSDNLGSLYNKC